MFLGTYQHRLDDKGRVTLPSKFRGNLGGEVVITKGFDRCLLLFPMPRWEELAAKLDALPLGIRDARRLRRKIFGGAHLVAPDRMGRVLIPADLREHAGIDHEVVIVGLRTYVELWAPDAHQVQEEQAEGDETGGDSWKNLGI